MLGWPQCITTVGCLTLLPKLRKRLSRVAKDFLDSHDAYMTVNQVPPGSEPTVRAGVGVYSIEEPIVVDEEQSVRRSGGQSSADFSHELGGHCIHASLRILRLIGRFIHVADTSLAWGKRLFLCVIPSRSLTLSPQGQPPGGPRWRGGHRWARARWGHCRWRGVGDRVGTRRRWKRPL